MLDTGKQHRELQGTAFNQVAEAVYESGVLDKIDLLLDHPCIAIYNIANHIFNAHFEVD